MDVLFVVNSVGPTSIPADIAMGLNQRDEIDVGLVSWLNAKPFPGSEELGVYSLKPYRSGERIRKLYNIVEDYDVVHTHHPHSGSLAKIVGSLSGVPIVVTENSTHKRLTRRGFYANGLTNVVADSVICVSNTVRESFEKWERWLISSSIKTIYNGVDFARIPKMESKDCELIDQNRVSDDSFVICHAGAMKPAKSQRTLIEAVESLIKSNRDVELVIAGDGSLRSNLEALVRVQGLSDVVHFLGELPREDVYRLMTASDLFVMPSRSEAYCVAVAEAMATKTPCILSNIDVFREVYKDVPLYYNVDDSNHLATQIDHLLEDPSRREQIAQRGYNLVKNKYSLESTVNSYQILYDSII